jgi:hypothetical protein
MRLLKVRWDKRAISRVWETDQGIVETRTLILEFDVEPTTFIYTCGDKRSVRGLNPLTSAKTHDPIVLLREAGYQ